MADTLQSLIVDSVVAPRALAGRLIDWKWPQDAVLSAFALVVVLNALVFGVLNLGTDIRDELAMLANSPLTYAALLAVAVATMIAALTFVGRMIGGQGEWVDMAKVVIWLQALRALAQGVLGMVVLVAPNIAFVMGVVASLLGIWILLNFVESVHRFGQPLKALLTLLIAAVLTSIVFGLAVNAMGLTA